MRDRYKGTFEISTVYLPAWRPPVPNTHASVSWHTGESGKGVRDRKGRRNKILMRPITVNGAADAAHPEIEHNIHVFGPRSMTLRSSPSRYPTHKSSSHLITYPHHILPPTHLTSQTRRVLSRSSTSEANTFSTTLITNFWPSLYLQSEEK